MTGLFPLTMSKNDGILCCLLLVILGSTSLYTRYLRNTILMIKLHPEREPSHRINLDDTLNFGARPAVQTSTSWNAPIIWEGMFEPNLFDQKHIGEKSSVALTVFAVVPGCLPQDFPHLSRTTFYVGITSDVLCVYRFTRQSTKHHTCF